MPPGCRTNLPIVQSSQYLRHFEHWSLFSIIFATFRGINAWFPRAFIIYFTCFSYVFSKIKFSWKQQTGQPLRSPGLVIWSLTQQPLLRASPAEICAFGAVEEFGLEELNSEIYPQSGPNCDIVVVDKVTVVVDGAVITDSGSAARTVAGWPQPPPAESITGYICALCEAVSCSLTPSGTVEAEIPVRFCDA